MKSVRRVRAWELFPRLIDTAPVRHSCWSLEAENVTHLRLQNPFTVDTSAP